MLVISEGLFEFKIDNLGIYYNIIFLVDLFTTQRILQNSFLRVQVIKAYSNVKRGTIFYGSYMKGLPFLSKMVHKGKDLDPKTEPPGINFVE